MKGIDSGHKLSELLSGRGAHIIAVAGKNLSMQLLNKRRCQKVAVKLLFDRGQPVKQQLRSLYRCDKAADKLKRPTKRPTKAAQSLFGVPTSRQFGKPQNTRTKTYHPNGHS